MFDPTQSPGAGHRGRQQLGNFPSASPSTAPTSGPPTTGRRFGVDHHAAGNDPVSGTTVTTGFTNPTGILYDGAHIWVTDFGAGALLKLDPTGTILQTVTVGVGPEFPAFDGANIWVPNFNDNSITVVQASTGNVVATITQMRTTS